MDHPQEQGSGTSQFWWKSTKVIPIEKTLTSFVSTMNQGFKSKGTRATVCVGQTVINTCLCYLPNTSRWQ